MRQSFELFFASSNIHKYHEAKEILDSFGINLGFFKCSLEEIQSESLKAIAAKKAMITSRVNTLLSIPMLLTMVAAQNLY